MLVTARWQASKKAESGSAKGKALVKETASLSISINKGWTRAVKRTATTRDVEESPTLGSSRPRKLKEDELWTGHHFRHCHL